MIKRGFQIINESSIWGIPVRLRGHWFKPPTFDRLAALLLSKARPNGDPFRTWLSKNVQPRHVVLDIGANQGLFALAASHAVGPLGMVHAFEPDLVLSRCLAENLRRNGIRNVVLHNFALGSEQGHLKLYKNPYNGGDNRLASKDSSYKGALEQVRVERLDAVHSIEKFDLVKIDVQGWESAVLQGMTDGLDRNPRASILFEFWPYGMKMAGFEPADLLHFFIQRGYTLKENGRGPVIAAGDVRHFISRLGGKRYTDIEACRL